MTKKGHQNFGRENGKFFQKNCHSEILVRENIFPSPQTRRRVSAIGPPYRCRPVIELSRGWEGSTPSSFFNPPPACSQKLPWGVRLNLPRAAFNSSMYLALCLHQKISNTCELQDDPIIRGYDSLVDYLL